MISNQSQSIYLFSPTYNRQQSATIISPLAQVSKLLRKLKIADWNESNLQIKIEGKKEGRQRERRERERERKSSYEILYERSWNHADTYCRRPLNLSTMRLLRLDFSSW